MALNILNDNGEPQKNGGKHTTAQIVQLSVVILVLVVLAYFVIKFVMGFIWWIVSILAIAVVAINYKLIWKIINYIRGLYSKNVYLGGAATLGSLLVFTPFVAGLFLKTIWDFRNSGFLPIGKKDKIPNNNNSHNNTVDAQHVELPNGDDSNLLQ